MQGWIKIHREMLESATYLALTPIQKCIMLCLIFEAEWKERKRYCSRCSEKIVVPVGGFFSSLTELSITYDEPRSTIYSTILKLEKLDFLERVINDCHIVYVIKNYHKYQCTESVSCSETERKGNGSKTLSILKEVKKERTQTRDPSTLYPKAYPIAEQWRKALPYSKKKMGSIENWCKALNTLHRNDNSWDDIRELIELIILDTGEGNWGGWFNNCQSPMKLLKKNKEGVAYFDYIKGRLQSKPTGKPIVWADPTS